MHNVPVDINSISSLVPVTESDYFGIDAAFNINN
jgi:hypothetical protein